MVYLHSEGTSSQKWRKKTICGTYSRIIAASFIFDLGPSRVCTMEMLSALAVGAHNARERN